MDSFLGICVVMLSVLANMANGDIPKNTQDRINKINKNGSFIGLVVPNTFELNPLLSNPSFVPDESIPYFDFAGKRFRFGTLQNKKVAIVMTGLGMTNAGIATQLLLTLFKIREVFHIGVAGNANPAMEIGDVVIPQSWAHTGLWVWQRWGNGPEDELPLESNGDYTRNYGYLNISDYNTDTTHTANYLNNVWYQPDEMFPVYGTPEVRKHEFWHRVTKPLYSIAKQLEGTELNGCVNSTTCLPRNPKVFAVQRGISSNIFVDNAAYRDFLFTKFNATPVDMESAGVAFTCRQANKPFIIIRALSDLAGGGSEVSNEADLFASLAAQNAVDVLVKFFTFDFKLRIDDKESFWSIV